MREQRLSNQNTFSEDGKFDLDTYRRENSNENVVSSFENSNTQVGRVVDSIPISNVPKTFNPLNNGRTPSKSSRNKFDTNSQNDISSTNFQSTREKTKFSPSNTIADDNLDYLYNDYGSNFIGDDYISLEENNGEDNDFSDYFLDAISEEEANIRDGNTLGIFIKEPNFAIDKTPAEFDRDQAQIKNHRENGPNFLGSPDGNFNRGGTTLLEPKFSIDQDPRGDPFRGNGFPLQVDESTTRNRGEGNLLEPDFALDYDIELPNSLGPIDNTNGIVIDEPDFAIDDFDISNNTFTGPRNNSLPKGIIGNHF